MPASHKSPAPQNAASRLPAHATPSSQSDLTGNGRWLPPDDWGPQKLFLCRLLIVPVLCTRTRQKRARALQDQRQPKSFVSCRAQLGSPLPPCPAARWHETRWRQELAFLQAVSFLEKRLLVAGPAHGKALHVPGERHACPPPAP